MHRQQNFYEHLRDHRGRIDQRDIDATAASEAAWEAITPRADVGEVVSIDATPASEAVNQPVAAEVSTPEQPAT